MRSEGYWNVNGHWRYKPTQSEQQMLELNPLIELLMNVDAEQMTLGGMVMMMMLNLKKLMQKYMNKKERRAYYGFRTSSSSIPLVIHWDGL